MCRIWMFLYVYAGATNMCKVLVEILVQIQEHSDIVLRVFNVPATLRFKINILRINLVIFDVDVDAFDVFDGE